MMAAVTNEPRVPWGLLVGKVKSVKTTGHEVDAGKDPTPYILNS